MNAFLKQFEQMKAMMKQMNKMPMGAMRGMGRNRGWALRGAFGEESGEKVALEAWKLLIMCTVDIIPHC